MVVIRLARHGRHKYPTYRIVAADKRRAATSKFLAILGTYNPHTKDITLNKEEIAQYLSNGAQASDRVLRILKAEGVDVPAWAKTHDRNKKPKKETEVKTEEKTEDSSNGQSEATGEVASEEAVKAEEKAEDKKTDVGTASEADDKTKEAETTEKVAEAVEKTTGTEDKK